MPRTELVIFDFDGTLVDTAPDLVRATNLFLRQKGFDPLPEARIRGEIGMGLKRLLEDIYPKHVDSAETRQRLYAEFTDVYEREYLKTPALFPGALEFLLEWPGRKAIVSNKRERFIGPILKRLGIDQLGWVSIIGGDTLNANKPHPEPFLRAMSAAGCSPEETVVVGDGIPDVQGALNVGSRCIAVEFGYSPSEELMGLGAWRSIGSFDELAPLIESIT